MDSGADDILELTPIETWEALQGNGQSLLVDVRSHPEWAFVGVPDISELDQKVLLVEWRHYPDMTVNPGFREELQKQIGDVAPERIFFMCRSGARSLQAARHMAEYYTSTGLNIGCLNVSEGFEGDIDASGHRGQMNGWKARGLAWRQS